MKSILAGLTLICWIQLLPSYSQTDSIYCLPISKARLLVSDALRLRLADSLNYNLSSRISLLESQHMQAYNSFTNLLKIEQDKNKIQSEIILHNESISQVYKEENIHLKKKVRGLKWKNFGLGLLVVVEAVIIITQ